MGNMFGRGFESHQLHKRANQARFAAWSAFNADHFLF